MIYDIQRLKLYNMYRKCEDHDIEVYGIKTDCLLVEASILNKVFDIFKNRFSNKIGDLKIERDKTPFGDRLEMINNEYIEPPKIQTQTIHVTDEYDKEELGEINKANDTLLYLANDAGCGKSTACCCGYDKQDVLFVSPFNKQCIELEKDGYDAVTIHKFFGKGVGDVNLGNSYDWSAKKLIIFDEILLNNIYFMNMVKNFVSSNKNDIHIIANGDINQLKPISSGVNNVANENEYRMDSVRSIFPNAIVLKEIKRLNKQSDRIKMHKIKKAIFKGTPIAEICETFGIATTTDMKDVNTTNNIAYFNYRCRYVNKVVHGKAKRPNTVVNVEGIDIWQGLTLQCKKFYKNKAGFKTYTNNLYTVEGIGKYIKIVDTADESNVFSMDRNMLWKIFDLAYCNTCHSQQGCSIDNNITIFDSNTPYVDRFWLYTAITRCRELSKICVFIHCDKDVRALESSKFKQYINHKIENYKEQDKVAGREITTDYVNFNWFETEFGKHNCCTHCQNGFEFMVDKDKNINSNLTFDRLDDSLCHSKDNLVLSCLHCNISKIKY